MLVMVDGPFSFVGVADSCVGAGTNLFEGEGILDRWITVVEEGLGWGLG